MARHQPQENYGRSQHPWMGHFGPLARDVRVRGTGDVRMRGVQVYRCLRRYCRSAQIVAEDGHAPIGERGRQLGKK